MSGGAETANDRHNIRDNNYHNNCPDHRMDVDIDTGHTVTNRGDLDTSTQAPCSSNGSGGEEDESEAIDREREAGDSSNQHAADGTVLGCGREQEVSVEIGETYLCQRADKTWRE